MMDLRSAICPKGANSRYLSGTRLPAEENQGANAMTKKKSKKYWSGEVAKHSDALDLESRVFTWRDPKRIARSLKKSAEQSSRRKGTPLQSAMSMLNFYINRGGKALDREQKNVLEQAKDELRSLFHKKKEGSNSA